MEERGPRLVASPARLTDAQRQRYSRHLLIPEVGSEGQAKLLAVEGAADRRGRARVAGGAVPRRGGRRDASGSSTSTSSTCRTSSARCSTPRTGSARRRSSRRARRSPALNPDVDGRRATRRCWSRTTSTRLIDGYDVILDGTDTFETRYILNDAAVAAGIPVVARVGVPVRGPADDLRRRTRARATAACTRRRRRPSSRPAARWPACWAWCRGSWACSRRTRCSSCCWASATTLAGRLVLFDALETEFTELRLRRDPKCPVCSDEADAAREAGHAAADPGRDRAGAGAADGAAPLGVFTLGGSR